MPRVTVLMPVYNAEAYVREAVTSVLNQTWTDFEFLIINDGSTDRSREIILSFDDPRIRLVDNETNLGYIETLNKGLRLATGEWVARQDNDDLSYPTRLERQVRYLDEHPEVGLVGAGCRVLDDSGRETGATDYVEESQNLLAWRCIWHNPFIHSSVMIRKAVAERFGGYDAACHPAEDYDLWSRMSFEVGLGRLPDLLVGWRFRGSSVSMVHRRKQMQVAAEVSERALLRLLGDSVPPAWISTGSRVNAGLASQSPGAAGMTVSLFAQAFRAFVQQRGLSEAEIRPMKNATAELLISIAQNNAAHLGWAAWKLIGSAYLYHPTLPLESRRPALVMMRTLLGNEVYGKARTAVKGAEGRQGSEARKT